jgi:hypothetical protein
LSPLLGPLLGLVVTLCAFGQPRALARSLPYDKDRAVLHAIVVKVAADHRVSSRVLSAIIAVESEWDPWAVHFEPKYRHLLDVRRNANESRVSVGTERQMQRTAFGLTQVVGGTARGLGFKGPLAQLLDPATNVQWGARYLRTLVVRYPSNVRAQVAAYNAGSAIRRGRSYINQNYVDLVMSAYYQRK